MAIIWSENDNNETLLAAVYLAFGKEAFSGKYKTISEYFGPEATYDAIQHRFRTIAGIAKSMGQGAQQNTRARLPSKSGYATSKNLTRRVGTSTIEADGAFMKDDLEVIEDGRNRPSPRPRQKGFCRNAALAVLNLLDSSSEEMDIPAGEDDDDDDLYEISQEGSQYTAATPALHSYIDPISSLPEAQMTLKADKRLTSSCTQSSRMRPEEPVPKRRMHPDTPSSENTNKTQDSWQQPQPPASPHSATQCHVGFAALTKSYFDPRNNGCMLCKKKGCDNYEEFLKHVAESELHHANLLLPERVRAADQMLEATQVLGPFASLARELLPGDGTLPNRSAVGMPHPSSDSRSSSVIVVDTSSCRDSGKRQAAPAHVPKSKRRRKAAEVEQSLPSLATSVSDPPTSLMQPPSLGTRNSPYILGDTPSRSEKGKGRAATSATPVAVRRLKFAAKLRHWSAEWREKGTGDESTLDVIADIAADWEKRAAREPLS